ncbi:voltage-dependent calcium channel subunit alpha-2/delta-2-like isoform X5 [Lytechinus variegatus]|uniref:voltage-dependent calcium channel subunit alpha-2/delta-2-like isoform X5 n=1 Tax=Lytechinus variegatus TaxID=7654 RepID=UPI001BB169E0|nr:voltage-dependent calcium channel subunit alpha-2/delta-2-like isoform X5 [Lytechinus variegatus]
MFIKLSTIRRRKMERQLEHLIRVAVFVFVTINVIFKPSAGQTTAPMSNSDFPELSLVKKWADGLSETLIDTLDKVTGRRELRQLYTDKALDVEFINGSDLIEDVADKWQAILQKKMTAVRKIVDKLEEEFANYTADHDIAIGDVDYKNSKNLGNLTLTYDERFKSDVNLNCSSVQIPTDIYEGDKVILNGIQATEGVDSVFLSNFEEDPQLLWQYFGSADGFYRSYPAGPDISGLYDARLRKWYIQATSSPKDVMILIDSSGSTFGMTLKIIKVSVSKALDTLGNDDFVNVAWFSKDVQNVSCFNTFVQANLRNKKELNNKVQTEVRAGGIADFSNALNYAFNEFEKFNRTERLGGEGNNQGADCIRVIMIFTDGGTSSEEAIFEARNRNPFKARVFVYKVGADSMVSSDGIRDMACTNKGYFSTIQSFGAVRLTTLDYVPVVSRPMVLSGHKNFQWSDIYLDALGLGMMTTLTLPVYNTSTYTVPGSNETRKSQQLLGVVGTDITTKNMADTVPMNKPEYNSSFSQSIGPQAYVFGVNSNGYILLHPRLKAEELIESILELNYLSDPPNVDFLEVEYETEEKKVLRRDMIDRKSGTVELETPIMSRDERYLEYVNMTYSYTFIDNTTFSVAIAQPSFDLYQLTPPENMNLVMELTNIMDRNDILIAPWEFCEQFVGMDPANITTDDIKSAIQDTIKNNSIGLGSGGVIVLQKCNDEMVRKLLVDAEVTSNLSSYWETKTDDMEDNGIIFVLAATQGGLIKVFPKSTISTWSPDEIQRMQDPWEQSYYQRSLYTDRYVFSVPYNDGEGPLGSLTEFRSNITISKSVPLDNQAVPAVVMVMMDPAFFNDSWDQTSKGFNDHTLEYSCANMELKCYLLDDGGFIIATNQIFEQDEVGRFYGEIDGNIMIEMTNYGIYDRKQMFDYQAACERVPPSDSAGIKSWFVPTFYDVFNFQIWAANALWTFIHQTFMDFLLFGWTDVSMIHAAETTESLGNVSCIKLINNYYFGQNLSGNGAKECVNCSRSWAASRVDGTNLVMLVTESDLDCDTCPLTVVRQSPQELGPEDAPSPCDETPRYRRRPSENCYAFSPAENTTICRGVVSLASPWLLLILHIFYLGIVWFVSA